LLCLVGLFKEREANMHTSLGYFKLQAPCQRGAHRTSSGTFKYAQIGSVVVEGEESEGDGFI
jgi:hypothetical protein